MNNRFLGRLVLLMFSSVSIQLAPALEGPLAHPQEGKPRRGIGGACEGYHHCKAELTCWKHKCVHKRKAGSNCRRSNDCSEGMICKGTTHTGGMFECKKDGKTFVETNCPPGATCTILVKGRGGAKGKFGKCTKPANVGDQCDVNSCVPGARCLVGRCSKGLGGHSCVKDADCKGELVCVQSRCK
jgi:hypothetical protein